MNRDKVINYIESQREAFISELEEKGQYGASKQFYIIAGATAFIDEFKKKIETGKFDK